MTKITDLETDLAQFKVSTGERLDKLEAAIDSIRSEICAAATTAAADAEKRHAELLAMMARQSQPPPAPTSAPTPTLPPPVPPLSLPPPLPPYTTATTNNLPPPPNCIGFSRPHGHQSTPPPYSRPAATIAQSQPIYYSSHLIFDEFGFPIPTTGPSVSFPEINSTVSGASSYIDPRNYHTFGPGHSGERVWTAGADHRLRKLKMPLFDGEDVYGWVYRIERFFDIQGLSTTGEKLRAAVLCMEGQALSWFRWSDQRIPFRTWEHLKMAMLDRFQPSHEGDIYEQFLALEQEGSVREYIGAFETLAAQLVNIPEKVMEGTFIKGLKPEIRSFVRMLQPTGLTAMIKTALLSEEGRSTKIGDQVREVARVSPPPPLLGSMGPKPVTEPTRPPLKRMTEAEILEKRAKGLCFKCNGRFGPGHRCPDKTLQVLLIDDDDEASAGEEEPGGKHHAA